MSLELIQDDTLSGRCAYTDAIRRLMALGISAKNATDMVAGWIDNASSKCIMHIETPTKGGASSTPANE